MDAKKCDRCGVFYTGRILNSVTLSTASTLENRPTTYKSFDLCPECFAHLDNWLTELQKDEANETNI